MTDLRYKVSYQRVGDKFAWKVTINNKPWREGVEATEDEAIACAARAVREGP